MSEDPSLNFLRRIGDNPEASIGVGITVLAGAARVEGYVARRIEFTRYLEETLAEAARARAGAATSDRQREAEEAVAEGFAAGDATARLERNEERHRELAERLRAIDADDDTADELKEELERLQQPGPVLLLKNARVWAPGSTPMSAVEVPFVRIPVAAVAAWWLGTTATGVGS